MNPRRGHVSVRWAVRRGKNKNGSFAIQYQYIAWWSANRRVERFDGKLPSLLGIHIFPTALKNV